MINFRFHMVSLIAIFLALALGVLVGAGVIDRGVVDTLNSRLDKVERTSEQRQLENDVLKAARDRDSQTIESLQQLALPNRLDGEFLGLVAIRGVDKDRVTKTATAATQAGATVTGVLWIEGKWGNSGDDAKALAIAVGEPSKRGAGLRAAAWDRLTARLAKPPVVPSDTSPDLLTTLQSAGFVGYDQVSGGLPLNAFPGRNALFLLVIGENGDVPSENVVMPAATSFSNANLQLAIGDAYADLELGPARGDVFDEFRASELSRTISTVDDLDLPQGPMTATLVLTGLTCAPPVVGHYGYGPDTRPLPDFTTLCRGVTAPAAAR
jgi:hypothetical protein